MSAKTALLASLLPLAVITGCTAQMPPYVTLAIDTDTQPGFAPDLFGWLRSGGARIERDANGDERIYDSAVCRRVLAAYRRAQVERMQISAENILNQNTTRGLQGEKTPYRRRFVVIGTDGTTHIETDPSPLMKKYEPGNPAADERGTVLYPNVDPATEHVNTLIASKEYQTASAILARFDPTYVDGSELRMTRPSEQSGSILPSQQWER